MKTETTPVRCAAVPCSRWRSICSRPIANCVRSPRSRGWRICPTPGPCCAWALLRMGLAAHGPRHGRSLLRVLATRFPNGSRSTSTTRSTRFMAASSCGCSTPITTNMAFSRSSSSTAAAASSPPCSAPPNDQAARNSRQGIRGKEIKAFLRRLLRALRANWPKSEILLRGDSHYCCPEVLDWPPASTNGKSLAMPPPRAA